MRVFIFTLIFIYIYKYIVQDLMFINKEKKSK